MAVLRLTAVLHVLHDLLAHPQPSVAAWVEVRDRAARELGAVLAAHPSPLRPPGDGSQPSSRHPDREVIVRLNILLPYTLTNDRREAVQRVLVEAAFRLGGRITMWDLLYTDVPVSEEVPGPLGQPPGRWSDRAVPTRHVGRSDPGP